MPRRKKTFNLSWPNFHISPESRKALAIVILLVLALVHALAVAGQAGRFGEGFIAISVAVFGVFGYALSLVLLALVAALLRRASKGHEEEGVAGAYIGMLLLVGGLGGLVHTVVAGSVDGAVTAVKEGKGAGLWGLLFMYPIVALFGKWAGGVVLTGIAIAGGILTFNLSISGIWKRLFATKKLDVKTSDIKINTLQQANFSQEKVQPVNIAAKAESKTTELQTPAPIKVTPAAQAAPLLDVAVTTEKKDWKLPPFDLLDAGTEEADSGDIEANAALIQTTLNDFGIAVEMADVNVGPTVTQYTFRPETGVKLSQIAALQKNLEMALAASSMRMELPIPGKPFVGVEIPNRTSSTVRLRDVLQTKEFVGHASKLAFGLGRDVAGKVEIADLTKMPHLLVAGATNSGKSVGINTLMLSLLYRNTPEEVKFIAIDPKRVELTPFNGTPHLLTPVITEPDKAVNALRWAVGEMDRRYKVLNEAGNRNIAEYNKVAPNPWHYIVVVVDELAELMLAAKADVETCVVRLAQLARAVGIHLVLATQRPSVEVVTGLIKANITSRIAFTVASQIDSRTILDMGGAEKLLGRGDMLFTTPELDKPKRIQGAFVGEKEVKRVVDFFKQQAGAVLYNEEIVERPRTSSAIPGFGGSSDDDDDLYNEAKDEVLRAGKASTSFLQRRLRIGYARAARLVDLLEERGVVGPGEGAKPRQVLGADSTAGYGHEEGMDV